MKKNLLLGAFLVGALFTAKAQSSCDDAVVVTPGNSYNVAVVDGEYESNCWDNGEDQATVGAWYSVTAPSNGVIRINTNLASNDGLDTRVSIYSGECGDLLCWNGSDDISSANYLTDFSFPVLDGDTYLIVFDDQWFDGETPSFDFEVSFLGASCSNNTLFEDWSNIGSYYFCWGTQDLNGDVDEDGNPIGDENTWQLDTTNFTSEEGSSNAVIIFSGVDEDNDDYLVSNDKGLIGGNEYTVNVVYNGLNVTDADGNLIDANESFEVVVGNTTGILSLGTEEGIVQEGETLADVRESASLSSFTFTPEEDGDYFFAVRSTSFAGGGALGIFEISVDGVMGVKNASASNFSVYPNPATNVVNIANANAAISNVAVVDMNGRTVKSSKFEGVSEAQVNISDLSAGIYMMTISSDKGNITKKIVKN